MTKAADRAEKAEKRFRSLPTGIWALGFVSLFMDASSELVHSLLPVFMGTVLGASMATIGVIEGIAEAAASIVKVFSGAISDYLGKRKILAVIGYGLAAITKPVFPLATSIGWVAGARFVDRVGKGIRGAPRDALVAEIAPPDLRGAAYGLRQSLDSVGAFLGPLLAIAFMAWFAKTPNDAGAIKAVLWVAVVPAFLCVGLLVFGVREPEATAGDRPAARRPLALADAKRLPLVYWLIVALGAVFTLARFSEAFLILRAQNVGLPIAYVPAAMIVMNLVYAATSYPAGAAADRFSRRKILVVGLATLVAADAILAAADAPILAFLDARAWLFVGVAFWGLHMGLTQGLFSKLVADASPAELRGTAFGVFNLVAGGALLLASVIAGALWDAFGPWAAFAAGALFAFITALGLLAYRPKRAAVRP